MQLEVAIRRKRQLFAKSGIPDVEVFLVGEGLNVNSR